MRVWNHPTWIVWLISMLIIPQVAMAQDADVADETPSAGNDAASEAAPEEPPEPPAEEPAEEPPAPSEEPAVEEPPPAASNSAEAAPASGSGAPPSLAQPIAGQPAAAPPAPTMTTVPAKPLAPPPAAASTPPASAAAAEPAAATNEPAAVEAPAEQDAAATEPHVPGPISEEAEDDDDDSWFAWFSLSPQIGYSYFPKADFEVNGLKFGVENRNSFVAKLHIDLGGDGLAFELTPLFATEIIGGDLSSFGNDVSGGISGNFFSLGGQMTIAVRGSWGKKFFPHLGVGFHGAYLFGDEIEYGAELYGRFPAGFTWQFAKHLGLVVEFAFMVGATGIRKPIPSTEELYADLEADYGIDQATVENIDWSQYQSEEDIAQLQTDLGIQDPEQMDQIIQDQVSKAIKFGSGVAFELMVGFRFP